MEHRLEVGTKVILDRSTVEVRIVPQDDGHLLISPITNVGTDRNSLLGFHLSKSKTSHLLAERFKKAIEAGVVFTNGTVKKDINQRTYVCCNSQVHRNYNADLKRLGF